VALFVNVIVHIPARSVTSVPAENTIEVFIDDKPVQVDPNCTVLQVHIADCCILPVLDIAVIVCTVKYHTLISVGALCKTILFLRWFLTQYLSYSSFLWKYNFNFCFLCLSQNYR